MILPPKLPFPEYKWRWASFQCTEGINSPPVLLGVLRAARRCEGMPPSSAEFLAALGEVEKDTRTRVRLARAKEERNIIRNSGQYWKGFGLMEDAHGLIALTEFGRQLADGAVTSLEFASRTVENHVLPNPRVDSQKVVEQWKKAGLEIRPLRLILDVAYALQNIGGSDQAYVDRDELCKVVIPLSGSPGVSPNECARAILDFRRGKLSLDGWPDCVPKANDRRIAREFLLFLDHHGFMEKRGERYYLSLARPVAEALAFPRSEEPFNQWVSSVTRSRVYRAQIERPGQSRFRVAVLGRSEKQCLLTGANVGEVLQAAHIKPVAYQGTDDPGNGLCLRADIHILFDTGHLRIDADGKITRSNAAAVPYDFLPSRVALPRYVNKEMIKWRHRYL